MTLMQPSRSSKPARVTVLGSLNVDRIWSVAELPTRGETVLASATRTEFGGKGANQAVAACRQGARVAMMGAVGGDDDGERYRTYLSEMGVDCSAVGTERDTITGSAHVYVDARGENQIVVASGANWRVTSDSLASALPALLVRSDVLLAQLETPAAVVSDALRQAAACGVRTILNASPFTSDFRWDQPIDSAVINEHECRDFFQCTPAELGTLDRAGRSQFLEKYRLQHLVVTQGCEPTLHFSADATHVIPTYRVEPKDTVGAGDMFVGALAVKLAEGASWPEALWHANVAAALSTLSFGAQSAMPQRSRVEELLEPRPI